LALALGVAGQAVAQVYTLTDLNSIARIDPYSQRGMFDWSVEGQNQLYQQWFWYRIGDNGPEASINNISKPVVTPIDSRSISLAYSSQSYSVEINYLLTGGAAGSRVSDILETIRIRNLGTTALSMHFFQYSDFNLQGRPGTTSWAWGVTSDNFSTKLGSMTPDCPPARASPKPLPLPAPVTGEVGLGTFTIDRLNDGLQPCSTTAWRARAW